MVLDFILGGWTFSTKYFCVKVALNITVVEISTIEGLFQLAFEMMNGNEFCDDFRCIIVSTSVIINK